MWRVRLKTYSFIRPQTCQMTYGFAYITAAVSVSVLHITAKIIVLFGICFQTYQHMTYDLVYIRTAVNSRALFNMVGLHFCHYFFCKCLDHGRLHHKIWKMLWEYQKSIFLTFFLSYVVVSFICGFCRTLMYQSWTYSLCSQTYSTSTDVLSLGLYKICFNLPCIQVRSDVHIYSATLRCVEGSPGFRLQ